jgi:ferredoxin--NADP+ reductase
MNTESVRRIAVIGAGPSALFLVDAVLKTASVPVSVDVIDRLPTPYGLVRYGVAPDHANIKVVINTFHKTLEDPRVRFLGNVEFGRDLLIDDVKRHYDAVVFATGAPKDRRLGIPGEDLAGSLSATEFVAWYSGHPDAVKETEVRRARAVAVVGVGNVAIDVTRILAKPIGDLTATDMPPHVLEMLEQSDVRDVYLIGRRGPGQAKFTTKELRELGEIPGVDVVLDPKSLALDAASARSVEASAILKRNLEVLREFAAKPLTGAPRRIHLRFFESPVEILGDEHVHAIVLEKNVLDESENAVPTGERVQLDVQLVLRSVGYRGIPLTGVPFDDRRHVIPNEAGRVKDANGDILRGQYVTGWIKRGPSGVIGTNKADSVQTAKSLVADLPELPQAPEGDPAAVERLIESRGVRIVRWHDWLAIDKLEQELGEREGKPRVKVTDFSAFTRSETVTP